MDFDLKSWSETNGFVWCLYTRRDGKADGDLVCQQGTITTDGSRLIAVVSIDEPSADEPMDIVQSLAPVSLKRLTLSRNVFAFVFDPTHLGTVAAVMNPCRQPLDEVPWRALQCRLAWRGKKVKRKT
jgi:hypothetical protein